MNYLFYLFHALLPCGGTRNQLDTLLHKAGQKTQNSSSKAVKQQKRKFRQKTRKVQNQGSFKRKLKHHTSSKGSKHKYNAKQRNIERNKRGRRRDIKEKLN